MKLLTYFLIIVSINCSAMQIYEYGDQVHPLDSDFCEAVRKRNYTAIPIFESKGVDVNQWCNSPDRAIHLAIWWKDKQLFDTIAQLPSFNPNVLNSAGLTPLHLALEFVYFRSDEDPSFELLKHVAVTLLKNKRLNIDEPVTEPNTKEMIGRTALDLAACGILEYVKLVLGSGKNPTISERTLRLAREKSGDTKMVKLLMRLKDKLCGQCNQPNSGLRCSRCYQQYYCCPEHQKDNWGKHQEECIQELTHPKNN